MSAPRRTMHTIWIYWPDDDAIELHAAIDQYVIDNNLDAYWSELADAENKVGPRNVRQIKIDVDWHEVCAAFETPQISAIAVTSEPKANG